MEVSSLAVAVIIPVYNVEDYLQQCLESLLAQTLNNILFICVNDGSTDSSQNILKKYASIDSRIHILEQENQGLGPARNAGIEYALQYNPEYIGFVDSDDFVDSTMFEQLYAKATTHHADIAYCQVQLYDNITMTKSPCENPKTPRPEIIIPSTYPKHFFEAKNLVIWDSIYATQLIKTYNLRFPNIIHEDTLWHLSSYILANKLVYTENCSYHYRINRTGSIINTTKKEPLHNRIRIILQVYIHCVQWLIDHNYLEQYQPAINSLCLIMLLNKDKITLEERSTTCSIIKHYLPYTIYKELQKNIIKQRKQRLLQYIFSIRKNREKKRKVLTIMGIQFTLPIKA